jgi:hypothetical protein
LAFVPGWPAADHEEPDPELAQVKLDSGLYEKVGDAPEPEAPEPEDTEEVTNGN